jgi:raffinose/stachyose/melibiose transport system permease protein
MLMPTITICTFLTLTNGFKLFDQNLALTGGNPGKMSELLALNIYNTMYGTTGWQGVGQAKAVIFFIRGYSLCYLSPTLVKKTCGA